MIRRAEKKDIPGIIHLLKQVLLVHAEGRPDLFKKVGYKYTPEELSELLTDEKRPVFVYLDENGQVLGHCFCIVEEHPETAACYQRKTLYIDDLCVEETVRGQHIGTKLYEHVKAYAGENGFYNITLHVWDCNPAAMAFYKSVGLFVQSTTMETIVK